MHEFALAEAVIATALESAEKAKMHEIAVIEVVVGELQQIQRETFDFALRKLVPASEPRLASTDIRVRIEPAGFHCRPCGHDFTMQDVSPGNDEESEAIHFIPELAHSFLRCPACKSPDFEVTRGRGVTIQRIEGETA